MTDLIHADTEDRAGESSPESVAEVDLALLSSVTLARLAEEVRNEELPNVAAYNRTYNRHNR